MNYYERIVGDKGTDNISEIDVLEDRLKKY